MPRILTPGLAYKHLQRYRQVVEILTKYGFDEFIGRIRFWEYSHIERTLFHRKGEFEKMSTAQRLRLALEELGPTFVKLGQMLSTRPDIVPAAFMAELEKLQNRVAPIPTAVVKSIVETELKKPLSQIFSFFDEQPLAAASLAQVHRATVNGNEVVVKVQRPNISQVIEVDLDVMQTMAELAERYSRSALVVNPVGLVKEFSDNIKREMDFRIEANNMRRFAKNFYDTPWVHVPLVYAENGLTQRVLIMEYIEGIYLSDIDRLKREGYDLPLIARRGAEIGFRSTLEHGFFHADPHPGNLIILPENIICLLDYGMMGTLTNRFRERLGRMIYYIASYDERRTARALVGLMETHEVVDAETLEVDVSYVIQEYSHLTLGEIQIGGMLFRLLRLLSEHHIRFPSHLIWLSKAIATVEDVAQKIDPSFNMMDQARPFTRQFLLKNLNPIRQARESYLTALDTFDLLKDLPYDAGVILDQLKKGLVKIEFEHLGLDPLRKTMNVITDRLAGTVVLSSLIIGSALIVASGVSPKIGDIPVLAVGGFGLAAAVAISLIISRIVGR
jgi:ubiquinone biosynthesis protein